MPMAGPDVDDRRGRGWPIPARSGLSCLVACPVRCQTPRQPNAGGKLRRERKWSNPLAMQNLQGVDSVGEELRVHGLTPNR